MACNLKTAGFRMKQSEIWPGGGVRVIVTCIWNTLDLLVFKVILGLFGARLKIACILKMFNCRAKWIKICGLGRGGGGGSCHMYMGYLSH